MDNVKIFFFIFILFLPNLLLGDEKIYEFSFDEIIEIIFTPEHYENFSNSQNPLISKYHLDLVKVGEEEKKLDLHIEEEYDLLTFTSYEVGIKIQDIVFTFELKEVSFKTPMGYFESNYSISLTNSYDNGQILDFYDIYDLFINFINRIDNVDYVFEDNDFKNQYTDRFYHWENIVENPDYEKEFINRNLTMSLYYSFPPANSIRNCVFVATGYSERGAGIWLQYKYWQNASDFFYK